MIDQIKQQGYVRGDHRPGRGHAQPPYRPEVKYPGLRREEAEAIGQQIAIHLENPDGRYPPLFIASRIRDICDRAVDELGGIEQPTNPVERPIATLAIDTRIVNAIEEHFGIVYIRQLLQLSPEQLLAVPNMGNLGIKAIYEALEEVGLRKDPELKVPRKESVPTPRELSNGSSLPTFGALLRKLRQRRGISQSVLAALAGRMQQDICAMESGARCPPRRIDHLLRIASALKLADGSPEFENFMNAAGAGDETVV